MTRIALEMSASDDSVALRRQSLARKSDGATELNKKVSEQVKFLLCLAWHIGKVVAFVSMLGLLVLLVFAIGGVMSTWGSVEMEIVFHVAVALFLALLVGVGLWRIGDPYPWLD